MQFRIWQSIQVVRSQQVKDNLIKILFIVLGRRPNVLSSGVILYYGFCSDSLVLLFLLPGVSVLFPLRVQLLGFDSVLPLFSVFFVSVPPSYAWCLIPREGLVCSVLRYVLGVKPVMSTSLCQVCFCLMLPVFFDSRQCARSRSSHLAALLIRPQLSKFNFNFSSHQDIKTDVYIHQ